MDVLARSLASDGKRYVTIAEVSRRFGVSRRTAGRLLAELAREGYARRYSRRTYELLVNERG